MVRGNRNGGAVRVVRFDAVEVAMDLLTELEGMKTTCPDLGHPQIDADLYRKWHDEWEEKARRLVPAIIAELRAGREAREAWEWCAGLSCEDWVSPYRRGAETRWSVMSSGDDSSITADVLGDGDSPLAAVLAAMAASKEGK